MTRFFLVLCLAALTLGLAEARDTPKTSKVKRSPILVKVKLDRRPREGYFPLTYGQYNDDEDCYVYVKHLHGTPELFPLRRGDILLSFDDHPFETVAQLQAHLKISLVGHRARIKIRRDDTVMTLQTPVLARPRSGWLGVNFQIEDGEARLVDILPDSPASKAGLRSDDVITHLSGERFATTARLRVLLRKLGVGRSVEVHVRRGKTRFRVKLTLGDPPAPGFLGVHHDLEERKQAKILEIVRDSPAERAGLKVGDIITHFNGKSIEAWGGLHQALQLHKPGQNIEIKALRKQKRLF